MTSLDPSHIPNPFAKSKHTQWGAATHEVEVGHPSHRRRSSSFGSSIAPTSPPRPHFKLPVPDLRFEQSYLLSIKPFIKDVEEDEHAAEVDLTADENERTSKALAKDAGVVQGGRPGLPVQLDWIGIVWVTIRDQMVSPLIQGAVFGTLSIYVLPYVRSRLFGRGGSKPPKPKQAVPPANPEEIPAWRNWVNSVLGVFQTNITLRG